MARAQGRLPEPAVRSITPADVPAVAALHVAAWQAAYDGILPADFLRDLSVEHRRRQYDGWLRDRDPRAAYLVAVREGLVVGLGLTGPARGDDIDPHRDGEIYALYAAPDAWSTGVGGALLAAGLGALRTAGFGRVVLWVLEDNLRGRRFYERNGFATDGARRVEDLGTRVTEVRYVTDPPRAC